MSEYTRMDDVEFQHAKELVRREVDNGCYEQAAVHAQLLQIEMFEQIAIQLKRIAAILNDTGE